MKIQSELGYAMIIVGDSKFVNHFFDFILDLAKFIVYDGLKGGENLNERMKLIRKQLKLSQDSFGAKIGLKGSSVSYIESGRSSLTEQTILAICREFNVNENWLRIGRGDPFVEPDTFSLDEYALHNHLTALETDIIKGYMSLDGSVRESIVNMFRQVFDAHAEENTDGVDIEKELANYRRQLELEKGVMGKSSVSSESKMA